MRAARRSVWTKQPTSCFRQADRFKNPSPFEAAFAGAVLPPTAAVSRFDCVRRNRLETGDRKRIFARCPNTGPLSSCEKVIPDLAGGAMFFGPMVKQK